MKIESIVNEKILAFMPVETVEMTLAEAEKSGATGLFEDKYGDVVRVVSVGKYSRELCGGIHVSNSGQIGAFKILSESGIASGVRRIEAVTGAAVLKLLNEKETLVNRTSEILKSRPEQIADKAENLTAELKETKKKLESYEDKALGSASADMVKDAEEINGVRLITRSFENYDAGKLRKLSDDIKASNDNVAMVFASVNGPKVMFIVSLTKDLVEKGYNAGNMIKQIAAVAGGGGGGKPDMAQAGAKDPSKVGDALAKAKELL